ncbi:DUF3164 family protein [Piscinibacter sakaiensis]|uniref:DUF3164 family protein n=2 Tax=Piscinibacter sakaiensis TaxID=1547922 RepID=UPI0037272C28
MSEQETPKGYWKDARGSLIPASKVKDVDKARDATVRKIAKAAMAMQRALADFKTAAMAEVTEFADRSAADYGVSWGGEKGNITLTTFDGELRVIRAMQDSIAFDERLQIAKTIIDECVHAWAKGSNHKIQALVNHAFQVDKAGQVSVGRVLGLRQLAIEDERWQQAMQAIADSMQVVTSKAYLRVYQRGADGKYRPIALDLSEA